MESINNTLIAPVALIAALPLLGFVINGLGFRSLSKTLAALIGCGTVMAAFGLVWYVYAAFVSNGSSPIQVTLFNWIATTDTSITFSFLIDQLSLVMLFFITGVGSLIHVYSAGYMAHDEGFGKFFAFLNLFMFSMIILVLGSNYIVMFVGWEGVGLCSYLLIGFWNKNEAFGNAARKAFIMNRIGDLGFLIGIFLLFQLFHTVDYLSIQGAIGSASANPSMVTAITFCLFIGAMGKSAQLPLYTWLPDAMAGPTPVSALIHAATMVTAGIYMVVRSNFLFVLAPDTMEFIAWIGAITAVFAATIGLFQNDIKKVLAYSTVSQLGYMFLALGVGAFSSGMFHVITHAFFKALLFLAAGSVIHAMSDQQDIRYMGGLRKKLPITFVTFLVGTIAISGIPPFSGFFSKDEILAHVHAHSTLLWVLGLVGSMLTAFYMFRLLFLVFFGEFRGSEHEKAHLHESPLSITIPLMVLAVFAAFGGLIGLPAVFSEHNALADWLAPIYNVAAGLKPEIFGHEISHQEELTLMFISVAVAVVSIIGAYVVYMVRGTKPATSEADMNVLQRLVYNKYYVDEIYSAVFEVPVRALSGFFYLVVDTLFIDLIVNGIGRGVSGIGQVVRRVQTGATSFYLYVMVVAIVTILAVNLLL